MERLKAVNSESGVKGERTGCEQCPSAVAAHSNAMSSIDTAVASTADMCHTGSQSQK